MSAPHSPAVDDVINELATRFGTTRVRDAFKVAAHDLLSHPAILAAIWPREPTEGMIRAALDCQDFDPKDGADSEYYYVYKAMRDAWVAGRKMMSDDRKPVVDLETLDGLDERDLLAGYEAGRKGDGHQPSAEMNRAYWHGWCNGMCDSYRMHNTPEHMELVKLWLARERLRRLTTRATHEN